MDKNSNKTNGNANSSWLRTALNSSEVFSSILRLYDKDQAEKLTLSILKSLDEMVVEEDYKIYAKGEVSKFVYFIKEGTVSMLAVRNDVAVQIHSYCEGDVFGESEPVNLSKRYYVCKAKTHCKLLCIKVDKFLAIFKDYRQKIYPNKLITFQKSVFFQNFLKKTHMEIIAAFSHELLLIRNQRLYEQGYVADCIYLIIEGEVQLQKIYTKTKKYISVCNLQQGNIIGQTQINTGRVRQFRAIVTSEVCRLYSIGKNFLFSLMAPEATERLQKFLVWKQQQRNRMFGKHCETRSNRQEILQQLVRKPPNQLTGQTTLLKGIDTMVQNKHKSLKKNFGITLRHPKNIAPIKNQFFDFSAGLRPRVLHYRGKNLKRYKSELMSSKEDSKISDVRKIRKMYMQEYNSLMIEPQLPPLLRSRSVPVR